MVRKLSEIFAKVPQIEKKRTVAKQMARLERGPAKVIKISSLFLFSLLGREICTGFPQPNIAKPGETKIMKSGRIIVPIRSMCDRGSRVNPPCFLGRGSPSLAAVIACGPS